MRTRFASFVTATFTCALLAALAVTAAAQEPSGGRGFFTLGTQTMGIDELNSRLSANGYGTFSEPFMTAGGEGYGIIGRMLVGGEGMAVVSGSESGTVGAKLYKSMLTGGYGLFKVGYIAYQKGGFILYPSFGIGGGGLSLTISRDETASFDQFLADPGRNSTLTTGFLLLDLGIGADNLVILDRRNDPEGGIAFGVRAGYLFSPYRSDWGDALDGPDAGIEGVYLRIAIGGGGNRK